MFLRKEFFLPALVKWDTIRKTLTQWWDFSWWLFALNIYVSYQKNIFTPLNIFGPYSPITEATLFQTMHRSSTPVARLSTSPVAGCYIGPFSNWCLFWGNWNIHFVYVLNLKHSGVCSVNRSGYGGGVKSSWRPDGIFSLTCTECMCQLWILKKSINYVWIAYLVIRKRVAPLTFWYSLPDIETAWAWDGHITVPFIVRT
jgi:hypothetical protein